MISTKQLKNAYAQGYVVPLIREFKSEKSLFELYRMLADKKHSFFLDSARENNKIGSHSYIGWDPFLVVRSHGAAIEVERGSKKSRIPTKDPLKTVEDIFKRYKAKQWKQVPFFTGGGVGYFSYDVARYIEKLPTSARKDVSYPDIYLMFPRTIICYDSMRKRFYLTVLIIPAKNTSFSKALLSAELTAEKIIAATCIQRTMPFQTEKVTIKEFSSNLSKNNFEEIVRKAKEYIKAGDIYQANLSQRFSFKFNGDPLFLYNRLRSINPSCFAAFLNLGTIKIVSSSPERLIKVQHGWCETRPIAGTRPRGNSRQQRQKFSRNLLLSKKERAEHIMLVDLERNDLGRVCDYHTVQVNELMVREEYSHVIHIVSNVIGRLKKGKDQFDAIRAVFPGGTITGCPKVRSMEIIDELEPHRRGLYTGSIGYLAFNGEMDLNIVIRTLVLNKNMGYIQVGAGIVYDSRPSHEYVETMHKGKALIQALKG